MNKPVIKKYRGYQIHLVNGTWKYDIYGPDKWVTSVNTLKEAREYIKSLIWAHNNVPF